MPINSEEYFDSAQDALEYLVANRSKPSRELSKDQIKAAVQAIVDASLDGIEHDLLKSIAESIVFTHHYDVLLRRKLLYSLIPKSRSFPYEIIPLAVSHCFSLPITLSIQTGVLHWISALLEFQIIDDGNRYLHCCYSSFLNLLSQQATCCVACKILYRITRRADVTPYRIKILVSLCSKVDFPKYVQNLLSLYSLYRPDLVIRPRSSHKFPTIIKSLQRAMLNARQRLQDDIEGLAENFERLWPDLNLAQKSNPHHDVYPFPKPEIMIYADTLEEKKAKKLYVLQYKKVDDMVADVSRWSHWVWPNSPSTLLWKPSALALFKPHDVYVAISITNWLELALRTEIILEIGNPSKKRQEVLLSACISLLKETETSIPALYHFLMEFLNKWDGYSHMQQVLELLMHSPFITPAFFFESVLQNLLTPLCNASLEVWCAFTEAFSALAVTWAFQALNEEQPEVSQAPWPFAIKEISPLEGIFFLSQRLKDSFLMALMKFGPHPLLFITCISYYSRINTCCEELGLPLFVAPPPELILSIVVHGDVLATHRVGKLLSTFHGNVERVKKTKRRGDRRMIRGISLSLVNRINLSVKIFLDSTIRKAFNKSWKEKFSDYFIGEYFDSLAGDSEVKRSCCLSYALPYRVLAVVIFMEEHAKGLETFKEDELTNIIKQLTLRGLGGLEECALLYGAIEAL